VRSGLTEMVGLNERKKFFHDEAWFIGMSGQPPD
jgi:hypothetical protein